MALGEVLRRVVDVPDWAPGHRGDGRHRRRHRLRPAHRHPVPQQPRRRAGAAACDADARSRPPAAPWCSPASPWSSRCSASCLMGQPAMTGFAFTVSLTVLRHHGRVGDAAAGHARLRRPQHRAPARAVREPRMSTPYDTSRWYRWSRFVQRRPWVAAIGGLAVLLALAAPFLGIRFGFPDAAERPAQLHHPPGVRPARRRLRSRLLRADAAHRPGTVRTATCATPPTRWGTSCAEVDGVALVAPAILNPAGDTAAAEAGRRPPRRRTRRPRTWSTRCATQRIPAATSGTGLTVDVGGAVGRRTSTPPAASPTGCPSSSAASCWCRSCC